MATLSDRINVGTSLFTAVAAIAAAASAYFSYEQAEVANNNQLRSEQIAAVDKFTDSAILICDDFLFPNANSLWDFQKDDFKDRAFLDTLSHDQITKKNGEESKFDDVKARLMYDKANSNSYLAMKLTALESRDLDTNPAIVFIDEIDRIRRELNDSRKDMNTVNGLANAVRADHKAETQCRSAVGNLLVLYRNIFHQR